jgi:hypothetical protein
MSGFLQPVAATASTLRDAVVMGAGAYTRLGPKKGSGRQQRRKEAREAKAASTSRHPAPLTTSSRGFGHGQG